MNEARALLTAGCALAAWLTWSPLVAQDTRIIEFDEAIRIANSTSYGLGASVWTRDMSRARRFASAIEAGSVFVNGQVKSDPRLPFGGVKDSGFGRELGRDGMLEFVNKKTVWIR